MKTKKIEEYQVDAENGEKIKHSNMGDFMIDIFYESMTDYLHKLNEAAEGRYELDDYDMQVLAIVMDQYARYHIVNCIE